MITAFMRDDQRGIVDGSETASKPAMDGEKYTNLVSGQDPLIRKLKVMTVQGQRKKFTSLFCRKPDETAGNWLKIMRIRTN